MHFDLTCFVFRRIYTHYLQEKMINLPVNEKAVAKSGEEKLASWIWKQYKLYKKLLCSFIASDSEWCWEPAIKTMLELAKGESDCFVQRRLLLSNTFADIFTALLVTRKEELDADLLLIFRTEVFVYADCTYHALKVLFDFVTEMKQKLKGVDNGDDSVPVCVQNAVDLLRMITLPEEIDPATFYIPLTRPSGTGNNNDDSDSDNEDDNSDDDSSVEDKKAISVLGKRGAKKPLVKKGSAATESNKKRRVENILSLPAYQKIFNKVWIHTLSLPMTLSLHKTLLKHLGEHVLERLHNPLLLADYLTQCYNLGGIVAVLALESLFTLILRFNLDYPHFFESLYRLCTPRIVNAKYGLKFLRLLHMSLKSTNIPAYLVAAFIKRLAGLALQVSAPRVAFCLAQITWLLRQHRTCQVLLHRRAATVSSNEDDKEQQESDEVSQEAKKVAKAQVFELERDEDLESGGALQSSLWELEVLEQHFLHDVAKLATALRDPLSTSVGSVPIYVEQYLTPEYAQYQTLIEADLQRRPKKHAALAFRAPTSFLQGGNDTAAVIDSSASKDDAGKVLGRIFDW